MVNLSTSLQDKYPVVRLMAHFTENSSVHLSTMMAILSKKVLILDLSWSHLFIGTKQA